MISFQTNVASLIAQINLSDNSNFQTKTITALTSGYRINSSGDDAAGLVVANEYAANVAELNQGVLNGNQGVNTLQIIDGGLSNISTMLNRMQTLATESASTTFTGSRATLDQEYQTLIGEINREAGNVGLGSTNATNAAKLSVFIGGGVTSEIGSAVTVDLRHGLVDATALGLSGTSVGGTSPVTIGSVSNGLIAPGATETFTVNTTSGTATFGITGQAGDTASSQLTELNQYLGQSGVLASLDSTGKLAFSSQNAFNVSITGAGLAAGGETGINTALNNESLTYVAGDAATTYKITEGTTTATINLDTGLSDSAALQAINSQLASQGITDLQAVDTSATETGGIFSLQGAQPFSTQVSAGTGLAGNPGLVAPAANGTSTASSGGGGALDAINAVTTAVQLLGKVEGTVGAGENDLNYAIGLANSQITNFSAGESSIRDANVAMEAANLTKAQVLQQASIAAMAQANSSPQAVLALLKGQ